MNDKVEPNALYQLIYQDICLVDIRDEYQFQKLHLLNSINIPYDNFKQSLYLLPINKPIYVLCQSGTKSQDIVNYLRSYNYDAYYIDGGFQAFLATMNHTQYF